MLDLARELGLKPVRILRERLRLLRARRAAAAAGSTRARRVRRRPRRLLHARVGDFKLADERWDTASRRRSAGGRSPSGSTRSRRRAASARGVRGLRGFFLADPEDLSLLPLVDQFAEQVRPAQSDIYRIPGGNDRLATIVAERLRTPCACGRIVPSRGAARRAGVRVTIEDAAGRTASSRPTSASARCRRRRCARSCSSRRCRSRSTTRSRTSRYGCATRMLLQFERPLLAGARQADRAFGIGSAVRRRLGRQRGAARRAGILSLLAGGGASAATRRRSLPREGERGVIDRLDWLGTPARAARVAARSSGTTIRGPAAATRISIRRFDPRCAPGSRARPAASSSPASTPASSGRAT